MSEFSRIAYVWGGFPEHKPVPTQVVPLLGMMGMAGVLGCDVLFWEDDPPDLSGYDVFLVVMFALGRRQVADIRATRPDALIVGLPDPPPEHVFHPLLWSERQEILLEQLALCDWVGARCLDGTDAAVYAALLDKPTPPMPGPLLTADWFGQLSETVTREPLIVSCDHSWNPQRTAGNVAAVAALQRETGWPVIYTNATEHTRQVAQAAGLKADFQPKQPFAKFAALAARATVGIDLYAAHSMGRNGIVFAAVGTPCITSRTTQAVGHPQVDPWRPDDAVREALALIRDPHLYNEAVMAGDKAIEAYSIRATQARARALLERQGTWDA